MRRVHIDRVLRLVGRVILTVIRALALFPAAPEEEEEGCEEEGCNWDGDCGGDGGGGDGALL